MGMWDADEYSSTHIDFHLLVEAVVHDQTVGHPYAMRLHGMAGIVGVVSDIRVIKVCDLFVLATIGAWRVEGRIAHTARGHGAV